MKDEDRAPLSQRWAHLRFSVVGPLLASPPPSGELQEALLALASKEWKHPGTGRPTLFGFSTIERWYYCALNEVRDPVKVLRRAVRRDRDDSRAMPARLQVKLLAQYRAHTSWSYQLHFDNLKALVEGDESLGRMPSYATVRRFMKRAGLLRQRRVRHDPSSTVEPTAHEEREVRSYEADYVNALWHSDFHHGSLRVVSANGQWQKPLAFCVLDDRSRLVCHVQWYLSESAEAFVHGLSQAFQKRALPRSLMTDNGSAMTAAETTQGLQRLGVIHRTTLPYSPYQNGKQEVFWAQLEGRLLAMMERRRDLTLTELNVATQVWCEADYNRKAHSEIGTTPLTRHLEGPDRGRESPNSEALRVAFGAEVERRQRRSDGTISLEGARFEVPTHYRHFERVTVRYARWDLGRVLLIDPGSGEAIDRLYPQDKSSNASARRRKVPLTPSESGDERPADQVAPLLDKMLREHAATCQPTAYTPLDETRKSKNNTEEEER